MVIARLIQWLRTPQWGLLSLALIVGASGLSWITSPTAYRPLTFILGGFGLLLVAVVNYFVPGIGVSLVQKKPLVSAKSQYHRNHPVTNGFAEFSVYLDIPSWMDEFEIEIVANGPFNVSVWDQPAPVSFQNNILSCYDDVGEIPFLLRFGGDPNELGEASYKVHFREKNTQRKIYSMILDVDPNRMTNHDIDDLEPDVASELGINPESGEDESAPLDPP